MKKIKKTIGLVIVNFFIASVFGVLTWLLGAMTLQATGGDWQMAIKIWLWTVGIVAVLLIGIWLADSET